MLQTKDITLKGQDGVERTYVLSKFPAVAGREIITQYPLTAMPKIGDYATNQALMLKVMAFVGVRLEGRDEPQPLASRALVDNHVPDWELLARLEWAMMEYNVSFFSKGLSSISWADIVAKVQPLISQMLTGLSAQSSEAGKQPSAS